MMPALQHGSSVFQAGDDFIGMGKGYACFGSTFPVILNPLIFTLCYRCFTHEIPCFIR
ncbi:hypothetical protein SAMN06264348_10575 [Oceanospirillum linum]|nr:hypothetical protein SAMN04489856_10676 [Oleiphilus messinensis]SMP24378.1 hypothetical protein SAMN06264348_10575 [Oceanospirillum linum]